MKAKKKNISNLSDIEAKRLTSAFMDGNTTLEQESELYRYYSSANIAPELEEFRDMMLWYSNGLKSHSPDNLPVQKSGKRLLRNLIRIMTPIAAAIAVVAAFYMNRTQGDYNAHYTEIGRVLHDAGKKGNSGHSNS